MAVAEDMLKRIMGEPNSPTGKLVALRKTPTDDPLETGVWYSNFTRVKEEAERRGLPFFAMWTNGDLCGFCRRFTNNILEQSFLTKMRASGGLFWLGGSMDDNDEDKRNGKGFTWCMGPDHKVNYFPFFAVRQSKDGKILHEFFGSGHDYDQRKQAPEGTPLIEKKIAEILGAPPSTPSAGTAPAPSPAGRPAVSPIKTDTSLHIRFNPDWDAAHIARFQEALKANDGHCVCQKDKTPDSMCMCRAFLEKTTPGKCACGAFEKFLA